MVAGIGHIEAFEMMCGRKRLLDDGLVSWLLEMKMMNYKSFCKVTCNFCGLGTKVKVDTYQTHKIWTVGGDFGEV